MDSLVVIDGKPFVWDAAAFAAALERRGWSGAQAARELHVTRAAVSLWIEQKVRPRPRRLKEIRARMRKDADTFLRPWEPATA